VFARDSKGVFYSSEAILSLMAACLLIAALSSTAPPPKPASALLSDYRLAQDIAEASYRHQGFRQSLCSWVLTGDPGVAYWLDLQASELGACIELEATGRSISSSNCNGGYSSTVSASRLVSTGLGWKKVFYRLRR